MAQINVSNLTFCYEGSYDNIFENISFSIDTDWKLGFIGRNGKGKTTFLNLLLGKYEYEGSITSSTKFEYFPFTIKEEWMDENATDIMERIYPDYELWKVIRELNLMNLEADVLFRPYRTLSHGERTKAMLALLFSQDNRFLLIDEPTNHLDMPTRELLAKYLDKKKGYLLISHDRWMLDRCVDHILVLNRSTIQVEKGNFSSWWDNKQKQDAFERAEDAKLKREISGLEEAAKRTAEWADKAERSKIGFDPIREHERCNGTRPYIGEKSRRMQQQRKNIETRQQKMIDDKKALLKDIESVVELKLMPLEHYKDVYVKFEDYTLSYSDTKQAPLHFDMELRKGDRIVLQGNNGCGKSTVIKSILAYANANVLNDQLNKEVWNWPTKGSCEVASGLRISYINQDTSFLKGSIDDYVKSIDVSGSLFRAILRQLDFERVQFEKRMEDYSEGQKKKVLIAGSLLQQAHLYIWDEPLNYIDVFSRMQIEQLILKFKPTMLLVEHDRTFGDNVGTKIVQMKGEQHATI